MNIPIYRAKRKYYGDWVEGSLLKDCEGDFVIYDEALWYESGYGIYTDNLHEILPETLMISFDGGMNWWEDFKLINDHLKEDLC